MKFEHITRYLTPSLKNIVSKINTNIINDATEIRLRVGQPLMICTAKQNYFVDEDGRERLIFNSIYKKVSEQEISEVFVNICEHSVYSRIDEISSGYITIDGGHRVGVCGKAVMEKGKIINLVYITSLNFRIAHEIYGAADQLIKHLSLPLPNMIIVGPPACGKTTVLRDLCRQLSSGKLGEIVNCVLIDERNEIANVNKKHPSFDIGPACDILASTPKALGMNIATRSLSPDVIIFDEMSLKEEVLAVTNSLNSGVSVITSMHAGSEYELKCKFEALGIARHNPFTKWIFLGDKHNLGVIQKIVDLKELEYENDRNSTNTYLHDKHRYQNVLLS